MKAFVLGGGSIKGAIQAGAIAEILESGFAPDVITGISVGSLNGAFLAERAGRAKLANANSPVVWKKIGDELIEFWRNHVTKPDDLIKKKSTGSIAWNALWGKFDGLVSNDPLKQLVHDIFDAKNLRASPISFYAGSVNLASGEIYYADLGSPNLIDYIIASTAIPIVMPVSVVSGEPLYDGGMRDIAPLKHAIDAGATEIVCIACQPLSVVVKDFNRENILHLVDRVVTVMTNEILRNDLEWAGFINKYCPLDGSPVPDGPMEGYRRIPIRIVQPSRAIGLDIDKFTKADIEEMLELGRFAAREALKRPV